MRLLLQALKLCFWALPAQRLCTVAGLALMAGTALWMAPADRSVFVLLWAGAGVFITFLPAMVMGGPLWRAFSAQRAVALAPHGRARLLFTAFTIAVLSGVVTSTYFWALYLWLPVAWRMPFTAWLQSVGDDFALYSIWAMASFLAARSLLATFTVLLVLLGGGLLLKRLDLPAPNEWLPGGGLSFTLLCWAVFAAWYLRARRIAHPAWTSRRAEDEAMVTLADTGGITVQVSRAAALPRLLLGGRSMGRIILQWMLALGLLQAILVLIRVVVDVPLEQVVPLQFFVLMLVLPAMAALSWVAASRLRTLWLACGCSRRELFALGEGTLIKLALGVACAAGAAFAWLYMLAPPPVPARPGAWLALGMGSLAGAVLLPVYAALLRHGAATVAALVVAVIALDSTYLNVFVWGEPAGSPWWLALLAVAIVALRERARRRWQSADMPRAASAPAS